MGAEGVARGVSAAAVALAMGACGPSSHEAPPLGEVLVVVDTDMPVPALVSRLQIDVYAPDGTWYASRDVLLERADAWPTSFGVYAPDETTERIATVRLRAYKDGKRRDYRGERFAPRPTKGGPLDVTQPPPATNEPRILDDTGADVTPETEPEPLLTIDRLVRVRAKPGVRGTVHVVLRGACVGTMADIAGDATCIDTEDQRVPVVESPIEPETSAPSLVGSFGTEHACTGAPRDGEVCVPGSAFIFGSSDGIFTEVTDEPERIAVLAPFFIDHLELSVGRYRKAIADGFKSPDDTPYVNDGPLPDLPTDYASDALCTWSSAPIGRENYALACMSFDAARALCRFLGGDLPSEAQWEYAAAVAGRPFRTRFPWGGSDDVTPTCARAIWGRGEIALATQQCLAPNGAGFGPQPGDARAGDGGDVTPLGVVNMGGGISEWTRDAFAPFTANCWAASKLAEPGCDVASSERMARGGSWRESTVSLYAATRQRAEGANSTIGVRCVRPGAQ
jgi:formylglycine-generating enzyme required for sulfatase activity